MSVAFVREDSAATAQEISLPERPISPHPNLVTLSGLAALEQAMASARAAWEKAQKLDELAERRHAAELAARDMRYYAERLNSAIARPDPVDHEIVGFGARVTIEREDKRRQTFRIVGEDEADPRNGSISYVSPVARALLGKRVGDVVDLNGREVEILVIA